MPYKRRRFKSRRRRRRGKKGGKKNRLNVVTIRGPYVIPDQYRCKMAVTKSFEIDPGVYQKSQVFATNDLLDPFITEAQNQPMGFDQMTNIYTSYRVNASKISIVFSNTSLIPMTIAIYPSGDSVDRTLAAVIGLPYVKTRSIGLSSAQGAVTLTNYIKNEVILGDGLYQTSKSFVGSITSSPETILLWKLRAEALGGSGGGIIKYQTRITIEYWVTWFARVQLNLSVKT